MTDTNGAVGTTPCPVCDRTPERPDPEVVEAEPITHCEWCGAEYPVPGGARHEDRPRHEGASDV